MSDEFSVTTIIATRNRPDLLRRALRSIGEQTDPGVSEVFVVFDQSEPDASLVEEFASLPVRVITNERAPGLAGARNTGILASTGNWIALCDDDDAWRPEKLAHQHEEIERRPELDFVVGSVTIAYGDRRINRRAGMANITFDDLLRDRIMEAHPSTYLVRRGAIDDYLGLVDEEIPGSYAEDYDWLLRAARVKPIGVAEKAVALIQWHKQSYFGNKFGMIDEALAYLLDKTPEFDRERRGKARILGQRALAQAAMGRRREAFATARQTLRLDWREPRAYMSLAVNTRLVGAERLVKMANSVGRGI